MSSTGVRSGLLLSILGVWLIMRATHQDATHRTLIDHILGNKTPSPTGSVTTAVGTAATDTGLVTATNPYGVTFAGTPASTAAMAAGVSPLYNPTNNANIIDATPYVPTGRTAGSAVSAARLAGAHRAR